MDPQHHIFDPKPMYFRSKTGRKKSKKSNKILFARNDVFWPRGPEKKKGGKQKHNPMQPRSSRKGGHEIVGCSEAEDIGFFLWGNINQTQDLIFPEWLNRGQDLRCSVRAARNARRVYRPVEMNRPHPLFVCSRTALPKSCGRCGNRPTHRTLTETTLSLK